MWTKIRSNDDDDTDWSAEVEVVVKVQFYAMVVTRLLRACQRVKDGAMRFIVTHSAHIGITL